MSEEEPIPMLASRAGEIREAELGRPQIRPDESVNSAEGRHVAVLTPKAIRHTCGATASSSTTS